MLTDADRAALDLESAHWRYAATKEHAIRERFGVSLTRYYQRIARLVDDPEAIAYAPMTCARVRALRDRERGRRPA